MSHYKTQGGTKKHNEPQGVTMNQNETHRATASHIKPYGAAEKGAFMVCIWERYKLSQRDFYFKKRHVIWNKQNMIHKIANFNITIFFREFLFKACYK